MTNTQQLHEILSAALEYTEKSALYFDWMKKAIENGDKDNENYYWCVCQEYQEYEGKARGLLEAYKFLTGREIMVIRSDIRNEIESLCAVTPL